MELTSELTATLVDHMGGDDSIVRAMLVSTQGADALDATATAGRIGAMMRNKHGSPFEHNSMTFLVRAPIFVWLTVYAPADKRPRWMLNRYPHNVIGAAVVLFGRCWSVTWKGSK